MNFLKKIFPHFCLAVSSLLLIYIIYKSEIYWSGTKDEYYFVYYIISLSLVFFSIILFFFNQKINEYLIITSVSILVTLYCFEGYISISNYLELDKNSKHKKLISKIYEENHNKKFDNRTKLEIFDDLKKINNKITVSVSPGDFLDRNRFFPLSGVSNSETIFCNENGYYSIYQSDRYGFNNPDSEWDEQEIYYFLLGDSFTHGACVNRPNDIASVLRTLSKKSVLNLGYIGNGPLIQFATLREYLKPGVKNVIWLFCERNDFSDLSSELNNKLLKNYLKDNTFTQNLKYKQAKIDNLVRNKIKKEEQIKFKFELTKFLKIFYSRNLILNYKKKDNQNLEQFKLILKMANDFVINNNSKLYFVYLPEYDRYTKRYSNANYDLVKNIVNELNISFIDIHKEVFQREQNPLVLFPFELQGHYNVNGYKKVANNIYKFSKD